MNAQNTCNTYTLLQFNAPTHLKEKLNVLSDYQRVPRSAIINQVMNQYVREQFEIIEKDGIFSDLVVRVQEKVKRSMMRVKNPEPNLVIEKKTPTNHLSWEKSYI